VPDRIENEITALIGQVGAHGPGGINPDHEQLRALLAIDGPGPLQFVNLLAYRHQAVYPADHELAGSGLSGADAYALYGLVALEQVTRRGGRLTLYTDVALTLIGPDQSWDQVAVMEYPDTEAFLAMVVDPDYVAALVHRDAGLADTVVMVTRSLLGDSRR
jgi:uncharacterized protein (DUF1330 family)